MKTKLLILVNIMVFIALVAVAYFKFPQYFGKIILPSGVKAKFEKMSKEHSLAAELSSCKKKGGGYVFVIRTSNGFYGDIYYFDREGEEIDSVKWSDIDLYPNSSVQTDGCKVLESTFKI